MGRVLIPHEDPCTAAARHRHRVPYNFAMIVRGAAERTFSSCGIDKHGHVASSRAAVSKRVARKMHACPAPMPPLGQRKMVLCI